MKDWKENIVSAIVERSAGDKIIPLKEIAAAHGIAHIAAQDARDIMHAVEKRLPDYRPVRMMATENDSLFQSLTFIQNDVEFEEEPNMKKYAVKPEYIDMWLGDGDVTDEIIVTEKELRDMAKGWSVEVDDLMQEVVLVEED